ncbi:hypothetical protein C8R41DRAFT_809586 [Lentinula lateritia]|uniref:Secreted protein n=1 Tax=Lentinula lateritia TaxID=40482 RepID=A0ABQ8VX98_9AGAR|nr:hypothetical protein C8R41DRAFT_809586 [Lentinula lateritia]
MRTKNLISVLVVMLCCTQTVPRSPCPIRSIYCLAVVSRCIGLYSGLMTCSSWYTLRLATSHMCLYGMGVRGKRK